MTHIKTPGGIPAGENWRDPLAWETVKQLRKELEQAQARISELDTFKQAAERLVKCKGRYHTEQNMIALAKLFDVALPSFESEPVPDSKQDLISSYQELNMSNYTDIDVDNLNTWAIDAYTYLSSSNEPVQQEPVAWIDSRYLSAIEQFDASAYVNVYPKGGFDYAVPLYTKPQGEVK